MKIFNSIQYYQSKAKTVATLGTFDGVHVGHKKILERLIQNKTESTESLVLTFFPHPRIVLHKESDIKLLNTISEKTILLEKAGIDNLVIHPFDESFSQLSAEEFVKNILVDTFNIKKIIIGYDHHFGKNRTANINDLIKFGKIYDFEVEQILAQEINEISISSTKIRKAIEDGNINLANEYLGYEYLLSGTVIKGQKIGRTISFPTANLQIDESYKLIPKKGVYIVKSNLNNQTFYGMMNIGNRPTLDGIEQSIEVHFLNFEGDLYEQKINLSILHRIRDEQKFGNIEILKQQIEKDKLYTTKYLSENIK